MDTIFLEKVNKHIEHVKRVGQMCNSEETTKQALILPMLDIIGFHPYDPSRVKAEYQADFTGVKAGERVDYALFCNDLPVMFIEAKAFSENLDNHCPQLSRYFNATPEVAVSMITNGREWRFFTDLDAKNVMDKSPFLVIDLFNLEQQDIRQLYNFRHDKFEPEALRTLAEESIYLSSFTDAIRESLRNIDADFVKFIANKAKIQRQLNQKFLDVITPIVRQAVENAVSSMVITGLSAEKAIKEENEPKKNVAVDPKADIIDPDNQKIVTTHTERLFFEKIQLILPDANITPKDNESYYTVLFEGKINRWLIRYYANKQRPTVLFPFTLTDDMIKEIEKTGLEVSAGGQIIIDAPANVLRLSRLVLESYNHCANDENFKRKTQDQTDQQI